MNSNDKPFPCNGCAVCCKHIDGIKELKEYVSEDGHTCKYLNDDHRCDIYDKRPSICNVYTQWKLHYQRYTWDQFCKLNATRCEQLRIAYGYYADRFKK